MFLKIVILTILMVKLKTVFSQEAVIQIKQENEIEVATENSLKNNETSLMENANTIPTKQTNEVLLKKLRMTAFKKVEVRAIQAELCIMLLSKVFPRYNFIYVYSLADEDDSWVGNFMKAAEANSRFSMKYSTIERNDIYRLPSKDKSKGKPEVKKKIDLIILYIENILEGESIMKMWNKQPESHEHDDYVVIITKETSKSYSEKFLRRMWNTFYFFNMYIIDINEFKIREVSSKIHFYFYNPYKKSGDKFQEYELDENDVKQKSVQIFNDLHLRVMDLNGYSLKITIRDNTGHSGPIVNEKGEVIRYKGRVGSVVTEYADVLNFKPVYLLDKEVYNETNENMLESHVKHTLETIEKETDLFGNYRLVQYDSNSNIKYLKTLQQVHLVIVTPSALPEYKKIGTQFHALDMWSKIVAGIFLILAVILWTVIKVKNSTTYGSVWNKFVIAVMDCLRITHFNVINMPDSKWEKLIFTALTVWIFFIGNSFTATIVRGLAVATSKEIETLNDLVETDLMIANFNISRFVLIGGIDNMSPTDAEIRRKLYDRQFLISDTAGIWDACAHSRAFAVICPEYISQQVIQEYYDPKDGRNLLYELKEHIGSMYSAQTIKSTSPLTESFDTVQDIFFEAGFLKHWKEMEDYEITLKKMHREIESASSNNKLKLANLITTFYVWGFMLTVASIVFLIELLVAEVTDYRNLKRN